jgi:hypothetical protein
MEQALLLLSKCFVEIEARLIIASQAKEADS